MHSCAGISPTSENKNDFENLFNKICVVGSGKGRLEFLQNKYPFTYESEIDRPKNEFILALDFPIVGEKKLVLSLNPKLMAQKVNHSQIVRLLESQIGERSDKENIIQGVEEFFVLTSEFVQFRSVNKFPQIYNAEFKNDHFYLKRIHGDHLFVVDSYVLNQKYFERVMVKVFPKTDAENSPILTLFLVPESCEK